MLITCPYSQIHSSGWNSITCFQYDVNPNKNCIMVLKGESISNLKHALKANEQNKSSETNSNSKNNIGLDPGKFGPK